MRVYEHQFNTQAGIRVYEHQFNTQAGIRVYEHQFNQDTTRRSLRQKMELGSCPVHGFDWRLERPTRGRLFAALKVGTG